MEELHRLWDLLLKRLQEKGLKLQQALRLIQFMRECDKIMFWINDKEAFVTSDEFGQDLEHVEVLQKKFDEFQKDLQNHEDRVNDINEQADKLIEEQHPEEEAVRKRRMVSHCIYASDGVQDTCVKARTKDLTRRPKTQKPIVSE